MKLIDKYRDVIFDDGLKGAVAVEGEPVCVDIKNVADWFYLDLEDDYFPASDFPCLVSPWPITWFEWTRPQIINLLGEMVRDIKMRIGVLVLCKDISDIPETVDPIVGAAAVFTDLSNRPDMWSVVEKRKKASQGKGRRWLVAYRIYAEAPGYHGFELLLCEMKYLDAAGAEIEGSSYCFCPPTSPYKDVMGNYAGTSSTGPVKVSEHISEHKTPVEFALSFMHCKNVTISDVPVPRKVHDKRVKNGKHGGYTFKTLEIGGLRSQSVSEKAEGESELRRALHICRGHFRTYTKDNPLFGHFTGTVWVPMHTRGDAKNGVVKKDYRVRAPQ